MALPNTVVRKFGNAAFSGSGLRPVLAKDRFDLITMGDDFCFDAMDANCYAAGSLPAVSATMPVAGLVNLANDPAPALGRTTQTVTLVPFDNTKLPTFTGKGLLCNGTTALGLKIAKSGINQGDVAAPSSNGWRDFVHIGYFKATTLTNNGGLFNSLWTSTSKYCGFQTTSGGALLDNTGTFATGYSTDVWTQIAEHYKFSGDHSTVTIRTFANGALVGTRTGVTTAGMTAASGNAWFTNYYGPASTHLPSEIARWRSVWTSAPNLGAGLTDDEVTALVLADYTAKMPELLA